MKLYKTSNLLPQRGDLTPGAHRGAFVISLDLELHWGVHDRRPLSKAECNRLLAARNAVPRILDLFEEFSIGATWATVGMLFAHSREEAHAFAPVRKPAYVNTRLNSLNEQIGRNEDDDPFHFAPSLIAEISSREGQEIGSHSFSHYYCMESGQCADDFEADLCSAIAIAANSGYCLRSYVFPRNQVNGEYLSVLGAAGIESYRTNENAAIKKSADFAEQQRPLHRIGRLVDAYADLCGPQTTPWPQGGTPIALNASRYLRPHNARFAIFEPLLLRRIAGAMKTAAIRGEIFHLWFHPEDFASDVDANLQLLRGVLETFCKYRSQFGMLSLSMGELSSIAAPTQLEASA